MRWILCRPFFIFLGNLFPESTCNVSIIERIWGSAVLVGKARSYFLAQLQAQSCLIVKDKELFKGRIKEPWKIVSSDCYIPCLQNTRIVKMKASTSQMISEVHSSIRAYCFYFYYLAFLV